MFTEPSQELNDPSASPLSQDIHNNRAMASPGTVETTTRTASYASHASRNPLQPVIPPCQRGGNSSTSVKQSQQVIREIRQERQEEFMKDLTEYRDAQSKTFTELATKYHRKPQYIEKIMTNQTHYKKERSTNLFNAKVAWKRRQMNEENRHLSLQQLQAAVKDDPALQNLSEEREQELIDMLEAEKSVKQSGTRISNRAATLDYQLTIDRVQQEMNSLAIRTGIIAFAFFSRSHINDSMQPEWIATPGALEFLPDTMQTTAGEMGRKFELWAVTNGGRKSDSSLVQLRAECAKIIGQKLKDITNRRDVLMNYKYYDVDIRSRYNVQLRGWPSGVRFVAPGNLTTVHEVRTLHEALSCGSCCWVAMNQQEIQDLKVQLGERPIVKTRKPRTKRLADGTGDDGNGGSATASRKRKRTGPKSAPVVNETSDE